VLALGLTANGAAPQAAVEAGALATFSALSIVAKYARPRSFSETPQRSAISDEHMLLLLSRKPVSVIKVSLLISW